VPSGDHSGGAGRDADDGLRRDVDDPERRRFHVVPVHDVRVVLLLAFLLLVRGGRDGGREGDPLPVGAPREGGDGGAVARQPRGLAAVRGDEPDLARLLHVFLVGPPLRQERNRPAVGGKARPLVALRRGGQPARRARGDVREPDVRVEQVLLEVPCADDVRDGLTVGRDLRVRDRLQGEHVRCVRSFGEREPGPDDEHGGGTAHGAS